MEGEGGGVGGVGRWRECGGGRGRWRGEVKGGGVEVEGFERCMGGGEGGGEGGTGWLVWLSECHKMVELRVQSGQSSGAM